MPITQAELKYYLSGGAANTDANASLGGAISSTEMPTSLNGLFDKVTSQEAAAGDTEYRCVYLKSTTATLPLEAARAWIVEGQVGLEIGVDPAGINGEATTVANESTAPAGVTFDTHVDEANALALGNLAAGDFIAVWIKRIAAVGEVATAGDSAALHFKGDYAG